jgi:hypothetical protein
MDSSGRVSATRPGTSRDTGFGGARSGSAVYSSGPVRSTPQLRGCRQASPATRA